jgi:hypothetical protein
MGIDPDGREPITLTTIIVVIIIAAVVAGGTTAAMEYYHTGEVDPKDVAISAGIGAIAAGAALAGGWGAGLALAHFGVTGTGAAIATGAAGGIAGAGAAYTLNAVRPGGTGFHTEDFLEATAIGGLSGAAGGIIGPNMPKGGMALQGLTGATTAAAGYGIAAAVHPDKASWQAFALSVGSGAAAAIASNYAKPAPTGTAAHGGMFYHMQAVPGQVDHFKLEQSQVNGPVGNALRAQGYDPARTTFIYHPAGLNRSYAYGDEVHLASNWPQRSLALQENRILHEMAHNAQYNVYKNVYGAAGANSMGIRVGAEKTAFGDGNSTDVYNNGGRGMPSAGAMAPNSITNGTGLGVGSSYTLESLANAFADSVSF